MIKIILKILEYFKRDMSVLSKDEKKYTEEEIFFYAKKRIAEVYKLSVDDIMLNDVVGEGKLSVKPPTILSLNELDILNEDISGLAIICLGHIARIYSKIDKEKIIPFLQSKAKDERFTG